MGDPLETPEITVFRGARNAASVIGEREVIRRQPATYEELPGVTIDGGPRGVSQEPNIRGFRDEQVVIRLDGVRQNFNIAHQGRFFTDPTILNHVEVLRGGASTRPISPNRPLSCPRHGPRQRTARASPLSVRDLTVAAAMADRLALMQRGRIVAPGHPAQVLMPERLAAVYGLPVAEAPMPGGPLTVTPTHSSEGESACSSP